MYFVIWFYVNIIWHCCNALIQRKQNRQNNNERIQGFGREKEYFLSLFIFVIIIDLKFKEW